MFETCEDSNPRTTNHIFIFESKTNLKVWQYLVIFFSVDHPILGNRRAAAPVVVVVVDRSSVEATR